MASKTKAAEQILSLIEKGAAKAGEDVKRAAPRYAMTPAKEKVAGRFLESLEALAKNNNGELPRGWFDSDDILKQRGSGGSARSYLSQLRQHEGEVGDRARALANAKTGREGTVTEAILKLAKQTDEFGNALSNKTITERLRGMGFDTNENSVAVLKSKARSAGHDLPLLQDKAGAERIKAVLLNKENAGKTYQDLADLAKADADSVRISRSNMLRAGKEPIDITPVPNGRAGGLFGSLRANPELASQSNIDLARKFNTSPNTVAVTKSQLRKAGLLGVGAAAVAGAGAVDATQSEAQASPLSKALSVAKDAVKATKPERVAVKLSDGSKITQYKFGAGNKDYRVYMDGRAGSEELFPPKDVTFREAAGRGFKPSEPGSISQTKAVMDGVIKALKQEATRLDAPLGGFRFTGASPSREKLFGAFLQKEQMPFGWKTKIDPGVDGAGQIFSVVRDPIQYAKPIAATAAAGSVLAPTDADASPLSRLRQAVDSVLARFHGGKVDHVGAGKAGASLASAAEEAAYQKEIQTLARSVVEQGGGGPEMEQRAINFFKKQIAEATHPRMVADRQAAIKAIEDRSYINGDRNMLSAEVEKGWPDLYKAVPLTLGGAVAAGAAGTPQDASAAPLRPRPGMWEEWVRGVGDATRQGRKDVLPHLIQQQRTSDELRPFNKTASKTAMTMSDVLEGGATGNLEPKLRSSLGGYGVGEIYERAPLLAAPLALGAGLAAAGTPGEAEAMPLSTSNWFSKVRRVDKEIMNSDRAKFRGTQSVSTPKLIATQDSLRYPPDYEKATAHPYEKELGVRLHPEVYRDWKGDLYLMDGHHRSAALIEHGDKSMPADVYGAPKIGPTVGKVGALAAATVAGMPQDAHARPVPKLYAMSKGEPEHTLSDNLLAQLASGLIESTAGLPGDVANLIGGAGDAFDLPQFAMVPGKGLVQIPRQAPGTYAGVVPTSEQIQSTTGLPTEAQGLPQNIARTTGTLLGPMSWLRKLMAIKTGAGVAGPIVADTANALSAATLSEGVADTYKDTPFALPLSVLGMVLAPKTSMKFRTPAEAAREGKPMADIGVTLLGGKAPTLPSVAKTAPAPAMVP